MNHESRQDLAKFIRTRIRTHSAQQKHAAEQHKAGKLTRDEWLERHRMYNVRIQELQYLFQQIGH